MAGPPDFPKARLHVVTGKGGTGKSTVAAALALALATHGKDVLLCEVEGRQGIARMFDVDPLPYAERRIATGLTFPDGSRQSGGEVYALHIDAESALLEYLAMYYRLGRAGRALDRFGVIEFASTSSSGSTTCGSDADSAARKNRLMLNATRIAPKSPGPSTSAAIITPTRSTGTRRNRLETSST